MRRILRSNIRKLSQIPVHNEMLFKSNFDSDQEIIEIRTQKVMLIGINLPDRKNFLTATAAKKLCDSIQKVESDKEISVAVLLGCGGNFCTGLDSNPDAVKKSQDLIKTLGEMKKPVLASLNGRTTDFGFQLALMCDMRVMDETGLIGLGNRKDHLEMSQLIYKRLALTVGLSKAFELICCNCTWTANQAKSEGLINKSVECGSALGQAIVWARSISLLPLDTIIKMKANLSLGNFNENVLIK